MNDDDGADEQVIGGYTVDSCITEGSPMLVEEEGKLALSPPVARNAPSPTSQPPTTLALVPGKLHRRPPSPLHLLPQHSNYYPDAYPLQHHPLQHTLLPPLPPPGMIFYHPPSPLSPIFPPLPHVPDYVYYDPPFPPSPHSPDFTSSPNFYPPHYGYASHPISPEFGSFEGWGSPLSPMSNYSYAYSPTMTSPDPYGQFGATPLSPEIYECWGGGAWEGVEGREGEGVRRSRGITKWFDKQKVSPCSTPWM